MRLALVAQWLRAAQSDPRAPYDGPAIRPRRHDPAGRLGRCSPSCRAVDTAVPRPLAHLELAVPVWAERAGPTTWHPHHIAERYGLLTLIVLGESILAATTAVQAAVASGEALSALLPLIVGGLLIAFSMWWMYFDRPVHDLLTNLRNGGRLGLRALRDFCGRCRGGRRAGSRRRPGGPSHENRRDRRRRGRRDSGGGVPGMPLVSPLPPGVSARPGYWVRPPLSWSCSRRGPAMQCP